MLILIDGYNVIAPVAPPGKNPASDWLHRERMRLIDRLATQLDPKLASQTCVVFDATTRARKAVGIDAPADSSFRLREIEVRFAVNHDQADDLIEELIALHSAPKRLTVVSSDHRLQAAARRSGATSFDSHPWLDSLLDGKPLLAIRWPPPQRDAFGPAGDDGVAGDAEKSRVVDETTVEQWMQAFGITKHTQSQPPQPQPPRPSPKQRNPPDPQTPESKRPTSKPPKSKPTGDPKRNIQGDNPFPEGYGEDLL